MCVRALEPEEWRTGNIVNYLPDRHTLQIDILSFIPIPIPILNQNATPHLHPTDKHPSRTSFLAGGTFALKRESPASKYISTGARLWRKERRDGVEAIDETVS